jgi:uncharacterized protein YndB with AHSA1/START domain
MNEVRKTLHLAAPVQYVWTFLTDPKKMSIWLMDSDFSPTPGASFKFTSPPEGRWDGTIHCEVQDVIKNERVSYTWCANDIGVSTLVTFDLEPSQGGTRLTLTHRGFKNTIGGAAGRHAAGWTGCLKALRVAILGKSQDYDWSEFQITYFVDAPVPEVFPLWATADGMTRFWADEVTAIDNDGKARPGDTDYDNGDQVHLRFPTQSETDLEILSIEHNRYVLFSFGEDYGWVHVAMSREGKRTRVVLRQFGMPDDTESRWEIHANARGWWIFNLMNIQSVLVHGNDLRVREPILASGLCTLFQPGKETAPTPHDWALFDIYLYLDSTPAEVLRFWQTVEGYEQFFIAEMATDYGDEPNRSALVPGSRYSWHGIHDFHGEGQFLEVTNDSVVFTFGQHYQVSVSVIKQDRGTCLHLRQSSIGVEDSEQVHGTLNCRSCWIHFLVNLKSIVEHGIDLRDQNPATTDAISVEFNRSH